MSNFTEELEKLHHLSGAEFSRQVERIALRKEFHPLETDENIFSVGGEKSDDYQNLLTAARKAIDEVFTNPVNPAELASCKSLLANEYTTAMADPGNYADAILMRYSAGKDVLTGYADKIKAVSADKVKEIFGSLSEGMRIEYVVKPQE